MTSESKPRMRLPLVVLGIAAFASTVLAQKPVLTASEMQLRLALRDAWNVHSRWTRNYIVSLLADLPDSGRAKTRLIEGANDVADVMAPYYPAAAVSELAELVRRNVQTIGRAAAAARDGDSLAAATAVGIWSANSDSIVQLLARTNANWPASRLNAPLRQYQDQTWRQIAARARRDWFADVIACDQADTEARAIADALSVGIVKQFPDRFK